MTLTTNIGHEAMNEARLPRRDWILMPLLGLMTIALISGFTELIARQLLPQLNTAGEDCIVNDPSVGARGIPNSVCWEKIPEGPLCQHQ